MDPEYSAATLAELDENSRAARLIALRDVLTRALGGVRNREEFFRQTHLLVDELKSLGHDLWSFDTDGDDFEIWCGDWTRSGGGKLILTFRYPNLVDVEWAPLASGRD